MTLTAIQKVYISSASALLIFGLGAGTGWKLATRKQPAPVPAPGIRQQDGSLILPVSPVQAPVAMQSQRLPQGARVQRQVRVVVQPSASPAPSQPQEPGKIPPLPATQDATQIPCPPVEVDLTLVKLADGSQRVIASSPSGRVLDNSVDIPVGPAPADVHRYNWVAGVSYNVADKVGGLWLDYRIMRVTIGAEVQQVKQTLATGAPTTSAVSLRVGWQF